MSVPLSRRQTNPAAYVRDTRFVFTETGRIVKKLPKGRTVTEWQWVCRCAYEAYIAASTADAIYATTMTELQTKLARLNEARGKVNALAGMADGWMENPPQIRMAVTDDQGRHIGDSYRECLTTDTLQAYVMTCAKALHSLKGAVEHHRETMRTLERDNQRKTAERLQYMITETITGQSIGQTPAPGPAELPII